MMNRQEAITFAISSAAGALDQADAYGGLQNAIDSYRENIRDTLNDERAARYEAEAWEAFDGKVAELLSRTMA